MSERERLLAKRTGWTQKATVAGHRVYLRTGEYPDGRLGEIFVDVSKQGTMIRGLAECFAIAFSIALQHGAPLETLVHAFLGRRFPPAGTVVAGTPDDPDRSVECTSIPDYIVRELAEAYLKEPIPGVPTTLGLGD